MEFGEVNTIGDHFAHQCLLGFNRLVGVNDVESVRGAHGKVLFEKPALKNAEALDRVWRESKVHASLEVLGLLATVQNPLQRRFQARFEEEGQIRLRCEAVEVPHPIRRAAPHDIPCKGGVDVAVAEDDIPGAQQGNQVSFVTVGEIRGVDETECCWGEKVCLFALAGCAFNQIG